MDIYKSEYNQKLVVSRAIERERKYQDHKWGTIEESPHSIERWIEIIQGELDEAKEALWEKTDKSAALAEIIQTVAVGHACLEQHGIVKFRNEELIPE
jgi:uncharacterized protein (DUF2344 family)